MSGEALVVDGSVVLAYLVDVELSPAASRLFRGAASSKVVLWAPDLLHVDVLGALRRMRRRGELEPEEARRAAGWLPQLPVTTTGTGGLVPAIWVWGDALPPREAAYPALAAKLDAPLVTADARLVHALRRRNRPVIPLDQLGGSVSARAASW